MYWSMLLGRCIQEPQWHRFELWRYEGLAFMNWSGISDATYQGTKLPEYFGQYMEEACRRQGIPFPRQAVFGGALLASMRRTLQRLGAGNSFHEYEALGAYGCIFGAGIESPPQEAWYMLNTESPATYRYLKRPEEWWSCRSWVSMGQRPTSAEYNLELICGGIDSQRRGVCPCPAPCMGALAPH